MRYSFEFKVKCVEMYERGEYPDTPNGITTKKFRDSGVVSWYYIVIVVYLFITREKERFKID